MTYSKARNRATQKYVKANNERIAWTCKKGKKDQYMVQAKELRALASLL